MSAEQESSTTQEQWTGGYNIESVLSSVNAPSLDSDEDSMTDSECGDVQIFRRADNLVSDLSMELLYEEDAVKVIADDDDHILPNCEGSFTKLHATAETKPTSDQSILSPGIPGDGAFDNFHGGKMDREAKDQQRTPKSGWLKQEHIQRKHDDPLLPPLKLTEQWDMNLILQQLTEEGTMLDLAPEDSVVEDLPPSLLSFESSIKKRQDRIMEQLVELSVRQLQALPPVQQSSQEQKEAASIQPSDRLSLPKRVTSVWHSEHTSTVCIDLRDTLPNALVKTGTENNPEGQKNELKRNNLPLNESEHTCKSMLLRQLRSTKRESSSDTYDNRLQQAHANGHEHEDKIPTSRRRRLEKRSDVGQYTPQSPEKGCSVTEQDLKEEEPQKSNLEPPEIIQIQTIPAEMMDREKLEKERKSRQRMQTQLEGMKPLHSVSGRQPMAQQTPVLFHLEASYSPEMDILPLCSREEMLLLTIRLSSCGQTVTPAQHSGRFPASSLSQANIYHALLVWLITLVSPLNPQGEAEAPFQVLGLQQVWREEGLALYACVSPRHVGAHPSPKIRKHKGKERLRGTSSFYQQMSLYLSHTTLQSVTCWREELSHQLQGQLFTLNVNVPSVRLSSITVLNPDPEAVYKVFSSSSGFFWQTLETEEKLCPLSPNISTDNDMEVVPVVLFDTLLRCPIAFHHTLHLILTAGLEVCGLRLLYPQSSTLQSDFGKGLNSNAIGDTQYPPFLALALRGSHALELWGNISGPCDPMLARLTDQNSLSAVYGQTKEKPLLHYSRTSGCILRDLSLWFGGRIRSNDCMKIGIQNPPRGRSLSPAEKDCISQESHLCRPAALLTATTQGDIFLAVSPAIPPYAYGDIIHTCCQRGFSIHGLQNLRFSSKRAAMMNMSSSQVSIFCPDKPSPQLEGELYTALPKPRLHCLLLLLRRENAGHHIPALVQGLMNDLAEQGLLGVIRCRLSCPSDLDPMLCFHAAPYSDALLQALGASLHAVPDPSSAVLDILSRRPFPFDTEAEQVVILTMSGGQTLQRAGHFLRQIFRLRAKKQEVVSGCGFEGFEVLGLKWLPRLSRLQAKEITPYEVGDRQWQSDIEQLTSNPALVCVLRRIHAFTSLAQAIKQMVPVKGKMQSRLIMSAAPEITFRQAVLIFTDRDLVSDAQSRPLLKYTVPPGIYYKARGAEDWRGQTESIFTYMLSGPPLLYTVLILKPGSWSSKLGKILRKVNTQKFVLVGLKLVNLTREESLHIIPEEAKQDEASCQAHCDYLTSAPCLVLCLQRINAVLKLLELLGPEDPRVCKDKDQFLWRAQYGTSVVHNGMYGSTSYQAAIQDLKCFFPGGLICDHQSLVLEKEKISRLTRDVLLDTSAQRRTLKSQACQPGPSQHKGLLFTSALCQTTCLLFPAVALQGSSPAFIQGLEKLAEKEFHVTGVRLTVFDQSQAQIVAELYTTKDSWSSEYNAVMEGPCLLIAAQRDNAVTCFHSLMGSTNLQNGQNFTQSLLSPQSQPQANKILSCVFDSLTPDSIHQIVPQAL
ncbi:dynein axonemal assembly factor 8-like [Aquarana catesbeiana]|uniref:dynein axonemal assembly factor 8-like n=1 Tax=Aquarana catesbeiana TaxID=8400 RepID=UPI003CC95AD3